MIRLQIVLFLTVVAFSAVYGEQVPLNPSQAILVEEATNAEKADAAQLSPEHSAWKSRWLGRLHSVAVHTKNIHVWRTHADESALPATVTSASTVHQLQTPARSSKPTETALHSPTAATTPTASPAAQALVETPPGHVVLTPIKASAHHDAPFVVSEHPHIPHTVTSEHILTLPLERSILSAEAEHRVLLSLKMRQKGNFAGFGSKGVSFLEARDLPLEQEVRLFANCFVCLCLFVFAGVA